MVAKPARTLDEVAAGVGATRFTLDAFAGQVEFWVRRPYRVKDGIDVARFHASEPRFDQLRLLDDVPLYRETFVTRQRWPLRATSNHDADGPWLPGVSFDAWIGFAHDGLYRYDSCYRLRVPYWLPLVVFTATPTVAIVHRRRRRHIDDAACRGCGYDCRATPARCPECGTVR